MAQSKSFGRLLRMAVNGIAAYEGKNAPIVEDELGQQIGLSAAAIQRYKAGHLPPEPRTLRILAEAAVTRGHLDRAWLEEFLQAAAHPAPAALVEQLFPIAPAAAPAAARPDPNRQRMIERVRRFWVQGVLEQSLHGAALLELGLETRPGAVERPWDAVLQQPEQPSRPLPAGTPLRDVFEALGGGLLILGAPGAGKTTMLLELARDLLARAEGDPAQPIPVVVNLSTWAGRGADLGSWLLDELGLRYQVPRRIARGWLEADQLLPLLDGLDEVAADQREACVAALNAFRHEHGLAGLVVASRLGDYELLATRLRLPGAVLIRPLGPAQIDRYLASFGDRLAGLRGALRGDGALRELAESPLMLSIMSLAFLEAAGGSAGERALPATRPGGGGGLDDRRAEIFERYIERMFSRRAPARAYPPELLRRRLGWLALQMQRRGLSVFSIEGLQPAWLPGPAARLGFAALAGALMGVAGLALILIGVGAMLGLSGLVNGLLGAGDQAGPPGWWRLGLSGLGLAVALLLGLAGLGLAGLGRRRGRAAAALGAAAALLLPALLWLVGRWAHPLLVLLPLPLAALGGGLVGLLGGLGRLARGRDDGQATIRVVETLRWSPRTALPWLAEGLLAGQLLGLLLGWRPYAVGEWGFAALTTLISGLGGGLALGLLAALVGGLKGGELEQRSRPNQGIFQSGRHTLRAILLGPLVALALGPILVGTGLLMSLVATPDSLFGAARVGPGPLDYSLGLLIGAVLLLAAPLIGGLIGLASGGVACLQHLSLRVMLWLGGALPWDLARFLDEAADRLLLRKVGGSYIFVHRLLLEHLAAVDGAAWASGARAPASSAGRPTISLGRAEQTRGGGERARRGAWQGLPERLVAGRGRLMGGLAAASSLGLAGAALALALALYSPDRRLERALPAGQPLRALSFAGGSGELLAVGNWGRGLERWGSDGTATSLGVQGGYSYGLAIAPDGRSYAAASFDQGRMVVELRGAADGELLRTLPGYGATFSPDGSLVATIVGRRELALWSVADGQRQGLLTTPDSLHAAVAFSADGRALATVGSDNIVRLWELATGRGLGALALPTQAGRGPASSPMPPAYAPLSVTALALSPDGSQVAAALSDGTIALGRPGEPGPDALLAGHRGYIAALAFAPDGATLASGSADRSVRLWRAADGAALATLRGHLGGVAALAFSADGRLLASGSADRSVRLWRVGR